MLCYHAIKSHTSKPGEFKTGKAFMRLEPEIRHAAGGGMKCDHYKSE